MVTPYPPSASETFIRAHVERLPAKVTLIHSWPPAVEERPILSLTRRALYKAHRMATGAGIEWETTNSYVTAFRRYRAEAVLAEYGTTGVLTLDASRRLEIPLIVHFHGFDASVHSILEEHRVTYPRMFREAAAIIAVSRAMRAKLMALGAAAEKTHYISYGVDCQKFRGADPGSAPPAFIAVGRFVEKKGPQLTIRAFAEAHRLHPDARLRMVGDGPLLEECRELAGRLGVGDVVAFLGSRPHEVVREEMRQARCFVQHSLQAANGDCEGTPVGVIEAGASGLPVISTRHAGIPDVVVDGETGLLVEERDTRGMAECMVRLIREPDLAGRLGRSGRERVRAHFSMEHSLDQLWSAIANCMGQAGGQSR